MFEKGQSIDPHKSVKLVSDRCGHLLGIYWVASNLWRESRACSYRLDAGFTHPLDQSEISVSFIDVSASCFDLDKVKLRTRRKMDKHLLPCYLARALSRW